MFIIMPWNWKLALQSKILVTFSLSEILPLFLKIYQDKSSFIELCFHLDIIEISDLAFDQFLTEKREICFPLFSRAITRSALTRVGWWLGGLGQVILGNTLVDNSQLTNEGCEMWEHFVETYDLITRLRPLSILRQRWEVKGAINGSSVESHLPAQNSRMLIHVPSSDKNL